MNRGGTDESPLRAVESVFDSSGCRVPSDERGRAYSRALTLLKARHDDRDAAVAAAAFAVDMFSALAVDLAARPAKCAALVEQIDRAGSVPRLILGRGVLRSPGLLQLPSAIALEVQLTLLLTFTRARAVSLWTLDPASERLKHRAHAGEFNLRALQVRRVARRLLSSDTLARHSENSVTGVLVSQFGGPRAALVAREGPSQADSLALLEAAIPVLTATLARDELLGYPERRTRQKGIVSPEARLAQLRFDLHDGPQQDVILLAEDLRVFRAQLAAVVEGQPAKKRLFGRVDDLVARLAVLDRDLRRIGAELADPFGQRDPVMEVLVTLTDAFATRTGIEPEMNIDGDLTHLTDTQLTTLIAVLRETLTNIRKHSDAEHVTITLSGESNTVSVTVLDDGVGFEPEEELIRAARSGHIGLASIHERVRLLGGRAQIDSRPGGPTAVSAVLPRREGAAKASAQAQRAPSAA